MTEGVGAGKGSEVCGKKGFGKGFDDSVVKSHLYPLLPNSIKSFSSFITQACFLRVISCTSLKPLAASANR